MSDARGNNDVISAPAIPRIPVRGGGSFPVRRIYCVGRNFADHAREMGATAPASKAERGTPVFFMKPADAIVTGEAVPYPPATADLHHEVELVVAIGRDAPAGVLPVDQAQALVFGYSVGLDLTRRDLQAAAKAKGNPWDIAKGFDDSAPIAPIVPAAGRHPRDERLWLAVNGELKQAADRVESETKRARATGKATVTSARRDARKTASTAKSAAGTKR